MGIFALIAGLVMLVLIGIGIGVGLFACVIAVGLVMLGVVSSSVALGFFTKRPATAVRALLLQCGILAGIPAGAVTAWVGHGIINGIATWQGSRIGGWEWKIPLFGALGGACAGVMLALMVNFIFRRSHAWVEERVNRKALVG